VLAFADVFDLFMNELAGLRAWGLAFPLGLSSPFQGFLFRHAITSNPRLTRVWPCRRILDLVIILCQLIIAISVAGLLRCSPKFRSISRELDEQAFAALRSIMHATEERGYPPQVIPLLMLLTALCFMLSEYVTTAGGR